MDNLKPHKFAKLFPEIPQDEFDAMVADIKAGGLLEPIWLYNGQVLDGWHRYKAAKKAGIEPKTREWRGKDPLAFVESMNLMRRHLDRGARMLIRAVIEKERGTKPSATDHKAPAPGAVGTTSKELAAEMGVGIRTAGYARAVVAKAPELIPHILKDEDDPTRLPLSTAGEMVPLIAREKNPEKRKRIIDHQIKVRTSPPKSKPTAKYVGPKRWEDVPAVKTILDWLRAVSEKWTQAIDMAKLGKFSPEAGRFVAKRIRDACQAGLKAADQVERLSK